LFGEQKHLVRIHIARCLAVGRQHLARFLFDRVFLGEVAADDFNDLRLDLLVGRLGNDDLFLALRGNERVG